jgi:hypothetical protein
MADFVEYDHKFTWFRLPEQVEDFCNFVDALVASIYTSFNVSTATGNTCINPDLSPYNQVFYHDGALAYPEIGDIVYTDAAGTTLLDSVLQGSAYQMADLDYLYTDEFGGRVVQGCK